MTLEGDSVRFGSCKQCWDFLCKFFGMPLRTGPPIVYKLKTRESKTASPDPT